jgi:hypothetical protein
VKVFSRLIFCIKIFYEFYTFIDNCRDNATVNCVVVEKYERHCHQILWATRYVSMATKI